MSSALPIVLMTFAAPVADFPTDFRPVAPEALVRTYRKPGQARQTRAVVLIHGMKLFPIRHARAAHAELHDFQFPTSELARNLGATFDVYAFSYAQTLPVDAMAHAPGLRESIDGLRKAGYQEIVLIGHSCGGLIARQFVEAYPDYGVTKVIQVASPNLGSDLAMLRSGYAKIQASFVESCIPTVRQSMLQRSQRLIPAKVEFATVVCKIPGFEGDVLVWMEAAWPEDLQRQGIPVALVGINHFEAMKGPASVKVIAELAREKLTRWSPEQVEQARRVMFPRKDNGLGQRP